MSIDWSKAPEGATHYDSDFDYFCNERGFWNFSGDWREMATEHAQWGTSRYVPRPTTTEWVDGLPPVGDNCLWSRDGFECEVFIFAHHAGHAHGWSDKYRCGFSSEDPKDFKPLRTQSEIEREEVIDGALSAIKQNFSHECISGTHPRDYVVNAVKQLYDAGLLRKPGVSVGRDELARMLNDSSGHAAGLISAYVLADAILSKYNVTEK